MQQAGDGGGSECAAPFLRLHRAEEVGTLMRTHYHDLYLFLLF